MSNVIIKDNRLLNMREIKSKEDILERWSSVDAKGLFRPQFTDPLVGLYGLMYREDDFAYIKERISKLDKDLVNDPWKYVDEISHIYETCEISDDNRKKSIDLMKADETAWYSWIVSIPYTGIQMLCVRYAMSLQSLIKFVEFLTKLEVNTSIMRLAVVVIREFMTKAKTIDDNLHQEQRCPMCECKFDLKEWEQEVNGYIDGLVTSFEKFPISARDTILYSMLSSFRMYDGTRRKYDGKVRDEIIAQTVDKCDANELQKILHDSRWQKGKTAVFHRVMMYAEWSCAKKHQEIPDVTLLWQEICGLMLEKKQYIHYGHTDDQLFCWVCGKLLADNLCPTEKLNEIMSIYCKRIDGWNVDFDQAFQNKRAQYFFLTVGAMATEWLLRFNRKCEAIELIELVRAKWKEICCQYIEESEDESNFLQQFWARYALLIVRLNLQSNAIDIVHDFNIIIYPEYRLAAFRVFIRNLDSEHLASILTDEFVQKMDKVWMNDILFLSSEKNNLPGRNKRIIDSINKLRKEIQEIGRY